MEHKCDGCKYKGEHQEMMFKPMGVCLKEHNLIEAVKAYNAEKCPFTVPRQGEWISVSDRLPEEKQKVLLYSPTDGINIGHRLDEVGRFYVSKPYPDRPTHWMPLPEAPKMKGGAE